MKQVHESFSALMDSEADEFDLRRVLKTMSASSHESDTWRRYHLARSMMRRERDAIVDIDISADVMAALADEPRPVQQTAGEPVRRHSFSMMGGAAVAAAVSLMVITGVQVYNGGFGGASSASSGVASSSGVSSSVAGAQPAMTSDLASASSSGAQGGAMEASMQAPVSNGLPYMLGAGNGFGGSAGGLSGGNGLMNVGEQVMQPMFLSPNTRQSPNVDMEQAQTLQSYLERHSIGAAYSTGDNWMPLLRTPGALSAQAEASQADTLGAAESR